MVVLLYHTTRELADRAVCPRARGPGGPGARGPGGPGARGPGGPGAQGLTVMTHRYIHEYNDGS